MLASAISLVLITSACSSSTPKSKTVVTTPGTGTGTGTGTTIPAVGGASTVPITGTVPESAVTTAAGATTPTTATTASPATATDWEVVVGTNYATEALATAQITKLTAATFTGFTTKKLAKTYAVVQPGLTKDAATALAAKINAAKTGAATVFQLAPAGTTTATTKAGATTATTKAPTGSTVASTGTNYEVVAGIFSTSAKAQAQIDKLTKATFTGFSIKPTSGKFAVILAGMTNADATALAKKITDSGLALAYVVKL